jgi:short-subunit dehydrogenase
MSEKRWILFGASRGLGFQVAKLLAQNSENETLIVSRRTPVESLERTKHFFADLSQVDWPSKLSELEKFNPTHVLYCAGGGPYGYFQTKNFKDHQWAWRVSFEAAAQVLHWSLQQSQIKQLCFVGSKIAESQPDPGAASYCAAKHALKGLIESVQKEQSDKDLKPDLRLFSPGYMDTDLLPANAWPRQQNRVEDPAAVAQKLVQWLEGVC